MNEAITKSMNLFLCRFASAVFAAVLGVTVFSVPAFAQDAGQKKFKSPEAAFSALLQATKSNDTVELVSIFGPSGKEIISSGNATTDRESREHFLKSAGDSVSFSKIDNATVIAVIGKDKWSFPVPLAKSRQGWFFFTEDGKQEIINRGIGRNELRAIQVALAYVDGQYEYAVKDRDGDGVLQYARRFVSRPGMKDGLYWEAAPDGEASPLGPLFAHISEEGYAIKKKGEMSAPDSWYYFKILKSQGSNATGGERDYIIDGRMVDGFGLVAYPAEYGVTGIMTFIVNKDGIVYEKDLGPKTEELAKAMTKYDPDKTWKVEKWTPDALAKTAAVDAK